jgi:hypothetical protein
MAMRDSRTNTTRTGVTPRSVRQCAVAPMLPLAARCTNNELGPPRARAVGGRRKRAAPEQRKARTSQGEAISLRWRRPNLPETSPVMTRPATLGPASHASIISPGSAVADPAPPNGRTSRMPNVRNGEGSSEEHQQRMAFAEAMWLRALQRLRTVRKITQPRAWPAQPEAQLQ